MPTRNPDSAYKTVRGLMRGLDVLRAINHCDGGATSLEISRRTGIHRTTVRRLLETLVAAGYVKRRASDDSFLPTIKVHELSDGFTDAESISSVAAPVMGELMRQVVWPSDVATPQGAQMLIRESTHRFSPLSFHRRSIGSRLPMLPTALGQSFFCFSNELERETLLQAMLADEEQAPLARDARFIANLVARVRAEGFASNHGDWKLEPKTAAIAMPIVHRQRVVGSLNVIYRTAVVTSKEAARRFVPPLRAAVESIAAQMTVDRP